MKYCIFNWVPNFHNFKDDGYLACNNFIILSHLCRITLTAPVQYMYTYHKKHRINRDGWSFDQYVVFVTVRFAL